MREWESQSHVRWYCRYHVVFVPKYRKRTIFGQLRRQIGGMLRELCVQHDVDLVEGHAMLDHVHLLLSIPPKFSIANTVGFVKGKSAIQIHRRFLGRERNFTGFHFWARGYCVSTVGLDEQKIRAYIRDQEEEEKRQEFLPFGGFSPLHEVNRERSSLHPWEAPSGGLRQTTRSAGGS